MCKASRVHWPAGKHLVSIRSIKDEWITGEVQRIREKDYPVNCVRKKHAAMNRSGWNVSRDQAGQLMRKAGLCGMKQGK